MLTTLVAMGLADLTYRLMTFMQPGLSRYVGLTPAQYRTFHSFKTR
jgi:hypothetical protein